MSMVCRRLFFHALPLDPRDSPPHGPWLFPSSSLPALPSSSLSHIPQHASVSICPRSTPQQSSLSISILPILTGRQTIQLPHFHLSDTQATLFTRTHVSRPRKLLKLCLLIQKPFSRRPRAAPVSPPKLAKRAGRAETPFSRTLPAGSVNLSQVFYSSGIFWKIPFKSQEVVRRKKLARQATRACTALSKFCTSLCRL